MTVTFTPVSKQQSYLRLFLIGPSGTGKTYTAAGIAQAFGRVAVVDTERGSFRKCELARTFEYEGFELRDDFSPARYVEAIKAAASAGFDCLIIDSLSHSWDAEGGIMDIVDAAAARAKGNSFAGWKEGTPAYRALIEAILQAPLHIIATMRSKTEWVIEQGQNGKSVPRRIGLAPVMRQNIEYEADIVGDLDYDHNLSISKSRFAGIADQLIRKPGREFGESILAWLNDGEAAPTWQERMAVVLKSVDEETARVLLRGADPGILARDEAWERFQAVVAAHVNEGQGEVVGAPGGADTTPPMPMTIVPSESTPGVTYTVTHTPDGDRCDCPAFTFSHPPKACKHTTALDGAGVAA